MNQATDTNPLSILIVVPHPDDVEFEAAGNISKWVEEGANITTCIITNGAGGSNSVDVDLEKLIRTRHEEQLAAAKVLGVKDVIFLDYPDGNLQPTLELRRDLTRVVRKVRPNRVLLHDPTSFWLGDGKIWDYINHPDHRASGEAALYAVFPSAESRPIFPELIAEGLEPHHVNEVYLMTAANPNLKVDISKYIDRKIEAILCHKSQVDESIAPMVRMWDGARGERIGCQYAEYFQTIMLG